MAYTDDKKPGELTALTSLATDDVFVVGDTSDASEVAKSITKADLITDLTTSFAPALGADDNYVTDAEKVKLANLSGTNTGDVTVSDSSEIDLTLTGQQISAAIVAGSIDETKLDVSVNASLDLADSASQPGHTHTLANVTDVTASATEVNVLDGIPATLTATELGYVDGVTSAIQTQINAKQATITFGTGVETALGVNVGTAGAPVVNGGALGTPSSGTLTNCTGLPLAGVTDSTTEALGVGSLEVGHASDTTITRVSAGLIAVEGSNLIRASDVDDTPVNGETAVPVSSNWAFDHAALASSDTVVGHIEVATTAETNTGTDATRAVSPDGLAGSYAGTKSVSIQVYEGATDVATGDGKAYITIPEALNGMNLVRAQATVVTAGTTNATTVMIHNKTDAQDMLSGAISIASAGTVGTVGTINATYDDVATNDVLRIDVDSVSTTAPKGLQVILEFRLP